MGIRTGEDVLAALAARRPDVLIDGERPAASLATHPAFAGAARTLADLADAQHDPATQDALTVEHDGVRSPASLLVPRSVDDLLHRRRASQTIAQHTHGHLGRSPDYVNSALTAFEAAAEWFGGDDPERADAVRAYVGRFRDEDLLATHALLPPQINRSVSATEQLGGHVATHVVAERDGGIVVRGARMLATTAALADELLVLPSTVLRNGPDDVPYACAFAVPIDADGLRLYARRPLGRGGSIVDEPLSAQFEENDAMIVFDDVYVPPERIFLLGDPQRCNALYTATGAGALMTYQVVTRTLAKTEFYLGLAAEIVEGIGISAFSHVQEHLAELIIAVQLQRSVLRAAEVDATANEWGMVVPLWEPLNAARNWYPRAVAPRLTAIIRTLTASGVMALPSITDLEDPQAREDLGLYLQGATLSTDQRIRLFALAADASVSGFAGRETLYEQFFFGDPVRMAGALVRGSDLTDPRRRVREFIGLGDREAAARVS